MDIFNWFGSILGYLLWFIYEIVPNYGIAILLFTLIIKILMFPFSVKQQKSMASQTKVQKKVKELQKIYANDRMKLQMETQKLYEKEGVSMTGGCLTHADSFSHYAWFVLFCTLSSAQCFAYCR